MLLAILREAKKRQVSFYLKDDNQLAFKAPAGALAGEFKQDVIAHKAELIAFLRGNHSDDGPSAVTRAAHMPLSFAQQRLWFIDTLEDGSAQYNIPIAIKLTGRLNVAGLQHAINCIVARHEILRTCYGNNNGVGYQTVQQAQPVDIIDIDASQLSEQQADQQIKSLLADEVARSFDLKTDVMLRATLIRKADNEHILLFTVHHIAADGWSIGVIVKEFSQFYQQFIEGSKSSEAKADIATQLSAMPIQYVDYAAWQQETLAGDTLAEYIDFWSQQLHGMPETHNLPLDQARPANQCFDGAVHQQTISLDVLNKLEKLASEHNATLFMLLQSAFALLLARWSNSNDIVMGTPVAGRNHKSLENLVGLFVNSLVLRTEIDYSVDFTTFLSNNRQSLLQAFNYQQVPFESLVDELHPSRSLSYSPLFQIMFSLQNLDNKPISLPDLQIESVAAEKITAKFDLDLSAATTEQGLHFSWIYATSLFTDVTIERMAEGFALLLNAIANHSKLPLAHLPINPEQHAVDNAKTVKTISSNSAEANQQLIQDWVERREMDAPEHIAVKDQHTALTYRMLNQRANQLAHHLIKQGVNNGEFVALCTTRGTQQLIAMLAILKAGAAYMPIDPEYPATRIEHMIHDSGTRWVISETSLATEIGLSSACGERTPLNVIMLDDATSWDERLANPSVVQSAADAAYLIYTSGTTGKPKGVVVQHQAIVSHIHAVSAHFDLTEQDVVLPFATISVDAALDLIFSAWHKGACVSVRDGGLPSAAEFYRQCTQFAVTVTDLPPAYLVDLLKQQTLSQPFWQSSAIRLVVLGGEAFSPAILEKWQQWSLFDKCHLINAYGPTEAVVTATLKHFDHYQPITIGSVVGSRTLHVLDQWQQPVPHGVIGELYIAGDCLALEYLNQPEMTAERFVTHHEVSPYRMYKTGDLVRYTVDGELAYCGRVDQQVQIRGFRVEPEEIRGAILRVELTYANESEHAMVIDECIVQVRHRSTDAAEQQVLVAYLLGTGSEQSSAEQEKLNVMLREKLADELPDYMTPARFIWVDTFSYTANGKIDTNKLPACDFSSLATVQAPTTELEHTLCDIWSTVLETKVACVNQSFFELGGHSLLAVRVTSAVTQQLGVVVNVRDLFLHSSINAFALFIEAQQQDEYKKIPSCDKTQPVALSYSQQRLWFIDALEGASQQYNMPTALKLTGKLDFAALQFALDTLVARHQILRTCYFNQDGTGVQRILPARSVNIKQIDLSHQGNVDQQVLAIVNDEYKTSFDLANDLMLRMTLIKEADQQHVIVLNTHHIASDGWSVGLIIKEFCHCYQQHLRGQSVQLPELSVQYADFAAWQRQHISEAELADKLTFWQDYLADLPPIQTLPLDFSRPAQLDYKGALIHQTLDASLLAELETFALDHDVTLFMLLQTAFSVLVARWSDSNDVVMGSPIAGRDRPELENLVGLFVNTLVLRTQVDAKLTFTQLLAQQKSSLLNVFSHQDVPFEMLVDMLQPERAVNHMPLFQIMFSMQNLEQNTLLLPGLNVESLMASAHQAKVDLELSAGVVDGQLKLTWNYATALFSESTIHRLSESFALLLNQIVIKHHDSIGCFDVLPMQDKTHIAQWNNTEVALSTTLKVHEQFEQQVTATPDAIALRFAEQTLTYQQLNRRANKLAHYLTQQGIGPESTVAICSYRCVEMVVAIYAVLKAGAAYLPLDPELPASRIDMIVNDSQMNYLLYQDQTAAVINAVASANSLAKSSLSNASVWASCDDNNLAVEIADNHAAYMIYTSGTTGRPKGVVIEHLALNNRIQWMQHEYQLAKDDVVLQKTPFSFDVSVWEFIWPFTVGASLVVAKPDGHKDPLYLASLIQQTQVTTLHFVPSMLNLMLQSDCLQQCSSIKQVFCSGEALPTEVCLQFHQQHSAQLHNLYGPTEAAIDVSFWQSQADNALGCIPIGKPIHNIQLYILDDNMHQVPVGVAGELHIAGIGLAREYRNQPALTAEKFVIWQQGDIQQRVYKTGDMVKWLPCGNIEYLGRNDHQVKLNGLRVELTEIESAILAHAEIKEVAVVAVANQANATGADGQQLVAYISSHGQQADEAALSNALSASLAKQLPSYMVPSVFMLLDEMPLSANGKLDRKQLPHPQTEQVTQTTYVAPVTSLEKQICAIWQDILHTTSPDHNVGIHDGFFKIGGDSIKAIAVVTAMKKAGFDISVKDIFNANTIAKLAELISSNSNSSEHITEYAPFELLSDEEMAAVDEQSKKSTLVDAYPLTYLQQGMFFYGQLHQDAGVYHDVFNAKIQTELEQHAFTAALASLVQQHEILRASLMLHGKRPLQLIHQDIELPLRILDFSTHSAAQQQSLISELLLEVRSTPVEMTARYWQITLVKLSDTSFQYVLDFHHAMWDGWSIASFNSALFSEYRNCLVAQVAERTPAYVVAAEPTEAPLPYRYYVGAEQAALHNQETRNYWQAHLENAVSPWWSAYPLTTTHHHNIEITDQLANRINALAAQLNIQEKSVFLAAHTVLMAVMAGNQNVLTSYVTNGRPELAGSELTLGLFLNTLPLSMSLEAITWQTLFTVVEQNIQQAHTHRYFPVAEIQADTQLDFSASMFNYTNFHVYEGKSIGNNAKVEESFEQNNYLWATEVAKSGNAEHLAYQIKLSGEQAVFPTSMLTRIGDCFCAILTQMVEAKVTDATTNVNFAALLSHSDQALITKQLSFAEPSHFDLLRVIQQQAQRHSQSIALMANGTAHMSNNNHQVTYAQLHEQVEQTARGLLHLGVKAKQIVAVCLPRSIDYVTVMLALYRIGAVYLPMDPNHPADRLVMMLEDSQAAYLIGNDEVTANHESNCTLITPLMLQQSISQASNVEHAELLAEPVDEESLAYIIYTSGSTGRPKGVMISRKAFNQFLDAAIHRLQLNTNTQWLALTTTIFDISLLELVAPLCSGGTVHILPSMSEKDGRLIAQYLDNQPINVLQATPSGWKLLLAAGWQGKTGLLGLTGGEALSSELASQLLAKCEQGLVNCFGPTEATIWSHMAEVTQSDAVHLGQALSGYGFTIVDSQLSPVMPGVPGELVLSGHALAQGYLGRSELTAEKFTTLHIRHDDGKQQTITIYRTGDLVKQDEAQQLIYLGRMDDQVKIRGYRIELGEIEAKMRTLPMVEDVVVAVQTLNGQQALIGYVIPAKADGEYLEQDILAALSKELPEYMLPTVIMQIDAIPLTPNGKVNKRGLPAPKLQTQQAYIAPANETERQLADIWQRLLSKQGTEQYSTQVKFFDVGGDSLLATRLLTEISFQFNVEFSIKDIFTHQTMVDQAMHIDYLKLSTAATVQQTDEETAEMEW
ncbi:non-ribosomal peptide synthetase [Flocculibacter collagenilyticus]|uniref:non-ribosomal peptide synthetase n=1 Tax=Flocculibacter collagenilyticus TaxID=2744479 RepID=UPI0018F4FE9A|nr:non-ribosomal peptide synthetase [Flocculibacter collagenilyticus]